MGLVNRCFGHLSTASGSYPQAAGITVQNVRPFVFDGQHETGRVGGRSGTTDASCTEWCDSYGRFEEARSGGANGSRQNRRWAVATNLARTGPSTQWSADQAAKKHRGGHVRRTRLHAVRSCRPGVARVRVFDATDGLRSSDTERSKPSSYRVRQCRAYDASAARDEESRIARRAGRSVFARCSPPDVRSQAMHSPRRRGRAARRG